MNNLSNKQLKQICRDFSLKGFSKYNKKPLIIEFILKQKPNIINQEVDYFSKIKLKNKNKIQTRSKNKQNEEKTLNKIVYDVSNKIGFYNSINTQFQNLYNNKEINKIIKKGSRNQHYDLEIQFNDGIKKNCEVKESCSLPVDKWKTPWEGGVQILNGTCKGFRICEFYGREWYDKYIKSDMIKNEFNLISEIPTFEDWFKKDGIPQWGKDGLTPFGTELKNKCIEDKEIDYTLKSFKNKFVKDLIVPDKIENEFIEDINEQIKKIFEDKHCYLCIYKNEIKIWDKIEVPSITLNDIEKRNLTDLVYCIDSDKIKLNEIRIRWQNRVGISNISVQCK